MHGFDRSSFPMTFNTIRFAVQSRNHVHISPEGCRQAAVAMLLSEIEGCPKMFFIQRALHEQDPWSGQIAFPGGSRDSDDPDTLHTATRETMEEVGIDLHDCPLIGQLDDQLSHIQINTKPIVINCYVFEVSKMVSPKNSNEVHDSFWVRFDDLINPENRTRHKINQSDEYRPAIRLIQDRVLWGLTYRFVKMLTERIDLT